MYLCSSSSSNLIDNDMTEIEQKVLLVRKYIYQKKGVDIVDINLKDGIDLQKLDYAYEIAKKNFSRQ